MIKKIVIHNYKLFDNFCLELNPDINVIVGDNEAGKSTILEAINLALTKRLNGRFIENELSPFLFNSEVAQDFIEKFNKGENPEIPSIFIELYFDDDPKLAKIKGTINSLRENCPGIKIEITYNNDFSDEYEALKKEKISLVPIEYFKVSWLSFADKALMPKSIPIGVSFIDATTIRLQSGTDYYLQNIINEGLDDKKRVELAVAYRKLKEDFAKKESILAINKQLDTEKGAITDKNLV